MYSRDTLGEGSLFFPHFIDLPHATYKRSTVFVKKLKVQIYHVNELLCMTNNILNFPDNNNDEPREISIIKMF